MIRPCLVFCAVIGLGVLPGGSFRHEARSARDASTRRPLAFEPNVGQSRSDAQFVARGAGYSMRLTASGVTLTLGTSSVGLSLVNSNPHPAVAALAKGAGTVNYFIGNDPSRWLTNVPTYGKVHYAGVYPGVDLVMYGDQRLLEYDFVVQPGADPAAVALHFDGVQRADIDASGDLALGLPDGSQIVQRKPHVFQERDGARRAVDGGYTKTANGDVTFWLADYDRTIPLTIDPVIVHVGSFGDDDVSPAAIAVDGQGNAYITGSTTSDDLAAGNPVQRSRHAMTDAFVAKVDAGGTNLIYATYIGGNNAREWELNSEGATAIAVDASGNACVTGVTDSTDFPTVKAVQSQAQARGFDTVDAFVLKLNASGSALMYSTYLGGRDDSSRTNSIAVDALGNAFVGGNSSAQQFPGTFIGPPDTGGDYGFVTKFNPAGGMVFSARFPTGVRALAVDSAGQAVFAGQASNAVVVAKLSVSGSQFVYSTAFGPVRDPAVPNISTGPSSISIDAAGNAYVGGVTSSSEFRTLRAAQPRFGGGASDAFVASVSPNGELRYATFLGGMDADGNYDIPVNVAADPAGYVYVMGSTLSTDFPLAQSLVPTHPGGPVFRSDDGGVTWTGAGRGLPSDVVTLVLDPLRKGVLYAGTTGGVFWTTDDGVSWTRRDDGIVVPKAIVALANTRLAPGTLYAASSRQVFKSVDSGAHWGIVLDTPARPGLDDINAVAVAPDTADIVYVGGQLGFRKTTDGGRTWITQWGFPVAGLVVDAASPDVVYVFDTSGSLYKFTNGAQTSRLLNRSDLHFKSNLAIDPSDSRILYVGSYQEARSGGGVYKSTDGGVTWTRIPHDYVSAVAFATNRTLYASRPLPKPCLVRSSDGGASWTPVSDSVRASDLFRSFGCGLRAVVFDPLRPGSSYMVGRIRPAAYLTRLNPDGSLNYSTYLPTGPTQPFAARRTLTTDVTGNAYIVGLYRDDEVVVVKITPEQAPKPCPPSSKIHPVSCAPSPVRQ